MNAMISETGAAFNIDEYKTIYGNAALLKLQKRFIIKMRDRITKMWRITKLYKIINYGSFKVMELPRFSIKQLYNPKVQDAKRPIKKILYDLPQHERIESIDYIGQSNPNQQIVVDHVVSQFETHPTIRGITIKVAPGLGKSFIAKDIINRMKLKTVIVVPNTYLLDQWVSLLTQYFPTTKIGTMYCKGKKDGDIIVGIINTMADLTEFEMVEKVWDETRKKHVRVKTKMNLDDILKEVGLMIFDESHMYVSKEFKKVFSRMWAHYTIGLSATPDCREDGLDVIHTSWLGPILDAETLEGFNAVQDTFESDVHVINYHALNEHCGFKVRDDGLMDYSSIVESIITDPNRNELVIDSIVELMNNQLYTFVFSNRRAHLEHLYELLENRLAGQDAVLEMPEMDKKVILYGGSDENTIAEAKQVSTVVFTTYSYSSTGVSITKMNGLVLATPRKSNIKQIIGRIFRLGSDAGVRRVIVDISDSKLPLKSQLRKRIEAYNERGCDIKRSTVIAQ